MDGIEDDGEVGEVGDAAPMGEAAGDSPVAIFSRAAVTPLGGTAPFSEASGVEG